MSIPDSTLALMNQVAEAVTILEQIVSVHTFCEQPARCRCCGTPHHKTCAQLLDEGVEVDTGPFPIPCEGCKLYEDALAWLERNRPEGW